MTFTKEEKKLIKSHLPTIERIIVNHSYSNLTVEFRTDMKLLGEKLKLNFCTTCSSGIFNLVSRVYKAYNEQLINERKKENGRKKGNSGAQG
jgi:transcriptional regulator of NAD metabolism